MSSIERIEVFNIGVPLEKPFVISLGTIDKLEEIIVRILDNEGNVGWGESSPSKRTLGTSLDGILAALDQVSPPLIGYDPRRIGEAVDLMDSYISGNTSAKAAIDIAIHDLVGNIRGEPVWRMLGGLCSERVETSYSIGMASAEEMLAEAQGAVSQGFRCLKVKVGLNPRQDVRTIQQFREALGEGVKLTIDANQGWTRQEAVWALTQMAPFEIEFVEQPVLAYDIEGMAWVRSRSSIPVMADESVHSPQDALRVIQEKAVDYINIKLMKSGGLLRAKRVAAIAEAGCVPCMIGAESETNLSITAATHFALATKNVFLGDLGIAAKKETWFVTCGGSHIDQGNHVLYDLYSPGLGIQDVKEDWLGTPIRVYGGAKSG